MDRELKLEYKPNGFNRMRPELLGAKTKLVVFSECHVEDPAYLSWLHDVDVVRTIGRPDYVLKPVELSEVQAYVEAVSSSENDLFMAMHLRETGQFVGTVKAGHIDWYSGTADIGIMIGVREQWGQGLGTDSLSALCGYLFDEIGLRRLTAGVMAINPAMVRVFEKLGFRIEGKSRQHDRLGDDYIDHIELGCLRSEFLPDAGIN